MNVLEAPRTASMYDFCQDLKKMVLELLDETRNVGGRVGDNKVGQAYVNAKMEVLTKLNIFVSNAIKTGVFDMKELKLELGEMGSLDELMQNERGGVIEPAIQEIAKRIKPGQFERIDNREDVLKGITWGHFAGRVYRMIDDGKLPDTGEYCYGPLKRKDKFYLVRYTKEMMDDVRARRADRKKGKKNGKDED